MGGKKIYSYNEIVDILKNIPITFYPALLLELIEVSYKRKVWIDGGASKLVKRIENKIKKNI